MSGRTCAVRYRPVCEILRGLAHGAAQSHAMAFADFPGWRSADPGNLLKKHVARRRDTLRAYERVEWSYDGMLRAVEEGTQGRRRAAQAKTAIAELAESVTGRICRVLLARRCRGAWLSSAALGARLRQSP